MDPLWLATEHVSGIVLPSLSESRSAPNNPTLHNGHPAEASWHIRQNQDIPVCIIARYRIYARRKHRHRKAGQVSSFSFVALCFSPCWISYALKRCNTPVRQICTGPWEPNAFADTKVLASGRRRSWAIAKVQALIPKTRSAGRSLYICIFDDVHISPYDTFVLIRNSRPLFSSLHCIVCSVYLHTVLVVRGFLIFGSYHYRV